MASRAHPAEMLAGGSRRLSRIHRGPLIPCRAHRESLVRRCVTMTKGISARPGQTSTFRREDSRDPLPISQQSPSLPGRRRWILGREALAKEQIIEPPCGWCATRRRSRFTVTPCPRSSRSRPGGALDRDSRPSPRRAPDAPRSIPAHSRRIISRVSMLLA
jgi:hypothetical protein